VPDLTTLPHLLLRNARELGDRPAIREKDRGIWQTWSWRQYHDEVRDFALGLAALGVRRGDRLSVIGDNRPRLYAAQLAVQSLGGVSVAVYQDSIAKELAFVWNHAEVSVIVAEDQEQVDKILGLRSELSALRVVIYDDARGMSGYKHDWLKSYQEVQEAGRTFGAEHPGSFEAEIAKGKPDDVAIVCYTSGTTGNPKGAMITHANAIGVSEVFCREARVKPEDTSLAYLPMAWAGDATYTLFASLVAGFCTNCPESPETVQRDLRELGPTTVLAPPRIWENMLTAVQVRAADATPLKRRPPVCASRRPWVSSSSMVPCAISSASGRRNGRSPGARLSAPTPSASSAPSASISSRSTDPRRRAASCRCSPTPRRIPRARAAPCRGWR